MLKLPKFPKSKTPREQKLYRLRRAIAVLDYIPVNYLPTKEWTEFVDSAEDRMGHILNITQADDLCDAMFDAPIEAAALAAKKHADQQHAEHLYALWRQGRKLAGDLSIQISQKKILEEELAKVEDSLRNYGNH